MGRITAGAGYDYLTRDVATSRHDYYTGRGEAPGVWTGTGCAELELSGVVDAETMAVLYGRFVDPRTAGGVRLGSGRMQPEVVLGRKVSVRTRADGSVAEPVAAFDVTFSPSKSVSVLWATATNQGVRNTVVAVHEDAVAAALVYLEEHAGHTRGGVDGVRRIPTSGLIVAQFRHRTARATTAGERVGDPQLHSHCAILNRIRGDDGRWRTLDGAAIYRHAHAAGALYGATVERELSARLGIEWQTPQARVPMREITGIPEDVTRRFSSRRAQVLERYELLLAQWSGVHHRSPTRAERAALLDEATVRSRQAKRHGDIDLHDHWRHQLDVAEQTAIDTAVHPGLELADSGGRLQAGSNAFTAAVIGGLQEQRSWWNRAHVYAEVARLITDPDDEAVAIEVERIIGSCIDLQPDCDDRYAQPDTTAYTSPAIRDAETRILAAATVPARWAVPAVRDTRLGDDQVQAITAISQGNFRVATVIGPAGAGKTTMLAAAAASYERAGRPVLALTLSAAAARVVTDETGLTADTIAAWRVGQIRMPRGGLVIVDEASMVPTLVLDQLIRVAAIHDCRVALIGDYAQMGAPEAGGLLRDLATLPSATEMTTVRRFTQAWERSASTQLRAHNTAVAATYAERGRLIATTSDTAVDSAATALVADLIAGRDALVVVDTVTDARTVAVACQERLAAAGMIGRQVATTGADVPLCVGDLIQTRHNTHDLATSDGQRVLNRDIWRITGHHDGTLFAVHTRRGARVEILAGYVAGYVELAYASTLAGAQGRTVDTGHTIVTPRTTSSSLYVGMSRGRTSNHAHVITDSHDHNEFRLGDRTITEAFAAATTRNGDGQISAHRITQQWAAGEAKRETLRQSDRSRQAAQQWWTMRQSTLPTHVRQALTEQHSRIIDDLTTRSPGTWTNVIGGALSTINWHDSAAATRFVSQLSRAVCNATEPSGRSRPNELTR